MAFDWDDVRSTVHDLYMVQRRPLHEVRRLMRDRHAFNAS